MKRIIFLFVCSLSLFLASCSDRSTVTNPLCFEEKGSLQLSINIGKIGSLRKTVKNSSIEMAKLYISIAAVGQRTIFDTLQLTGGSQERTERQLYTGLAAWLDGQQIKWTLSVTSRDQNGGIVHAGDTTFTLVVNDTVDVALFLKAKYSMLVAHFYPIQDSVTQCVLNVDGGYFEADSSFPKQSLTGDTVTLSFDYLSASSAGIPHHIYLGVYGELAGVRLLLYTGDTTIIVKSGIDASYNLILHYVGPETLFGAAKMVVSLGKIGTVTFNGLLTKQDTIYVDSSATGANNGINWADAFTDLQDAMVQATHGSVILIARGTYFPDESDPAVSFVLKNGVKMYGGYPSGGGLRNLELKTILSGDILQDDNYTNNSLNVIRTENADTTTQVDGITITEAAGNGIGGGMVIINGSPKIENCTFSNNYCNGNSLFEESYGGAIYVSGSSSEIINCIFFKNRDNSNDELDYKSCYGGAIYSINGVLRITNCNFSENEMFGVGQYHGGAIYMSNGTISNCTFTRNACFGFNANTLGGALYMLSGSVINSSFYNNSSQFGDAGALYMANGTVKNCIFTGNYIGGSIFAEYGGAIQMYNGTIENCMFSENYIHGAQLFSYGGALSLSGGCVKNCSFIKNHCRSEEPRGGAIHMTDGTIISCTFSGNIIRDGLAAYGGAMYLAGGRVIGCTFSENGIVSSYDGYGGSIYQSGGSITNCTFFNNVNQSRIKIYGGAILQTKGNITNCTFKGNRCIGEMPDNLSYVNEGGALSVQGLSIITNCIFWGNNADTAKEIAGNVTEIRNCVVEGGYSGTGIVEVIITNDPLLDTLGDNGGPVHTIAIDPSGSAVNAGTAMVPPGVDISTDARGFPRDSQPDIGAFEVQ